MNTHRYVDGAETIRVTCLICGQKEAKPNKGLGRALIAAWETRHQHPGRAALAFCEPSNATTSTRTHIRAVGSDGLKTGGGITGRPLCDRDLMGGWDLTSPVTPDTVYALIGREVNPACGTCANLAAEIFERETM